MSVMGQSVDPIDLIEYHVQNVRRLWNGEPVRDLAESEAGYKAALAHLRGAVGALRTLVHGPGDGPEAWREYDEAVKAARAILAATGGQSVEPIEAHVDLETVERAAKDWQAIAEEQADG